MPKKTITTVDLFTETSRVVYDDNETAPEMSYKERALTAESNFHHTSRVVSGGNGGIINIKPSGESGGMFTHKSRVVDGDDSGIDYYTKSSAPFSHKSRVVNGAGVEVEEAPRAPITPFFCHTSVAFENGKEHRQEPGEPYKNSYMRQYAGAISSFSETSIVVRK